MMVKNDKNEPPTFGSEEFGDETITRNKRIAENIERRTLGPKIVDTTPTAATASLPACEWLLRKKKKEMKLRRGSSISSEPINGNLHRGSSNSSISTQSMTVSSQPVISNLQRGYSNSSISTRSMTTIYDELRERGIGEQDALRRQRIYSKLAELFNDSS